MEILDKIPGIINYAVVNAEDGSIEKVKGSSTSPLGDLTAFFSSAAEVIKNTLNLGEIKFVSMCYGANRLIIFFHNGKYLGVEVVRDEKPLDIIERIKEQLLPVKEEKVKEEKIEEKVEKEPEVKIVEEKVEEKVVEEKVVEAEKPSVVPPKVEIQLSRSINSKLTQINLLIEEFGSGGKKEHWLGILNQGLGVIATEILPMIGIIGEKIEFKQTPPSEKEDDIVQILRTVIDFLVKKAVEEMGSSQARVKVQAVIEKMKQI
ncbi:MAG: hypothetical protein ABIL22_04025 [candidate division WOR-3 bacterium]